MWKYILENAYILHMKSVSKKHLLIYPTKEGKIKMLKVLTEAIALGIKTKHLLFSDRLLYWFHVLNFRISVIH